MSRIKCQILEVNPERVKFALNNCDVSLANSLRRTLIAEVPTMAPHLITVYENTSVLHDEFLAQRIGLIPFYSQRVDKYEYPWKCKCQAENSDDCQTCKVQFRLQVHHKGFSGNKYESVREVTSQDIEPVYPIDENDMEFNKKPVMPVRFKSEVDKKKQVGIPIVKLNKGEQINLRFEVQKGIGKMHSRWAPTQIATFQPDPEIKINNQIETSIAQKQEIRDSCPRKVYQIHNGVLEAANPEQCIFCGECQKKAEMISMERLKNFIKVGKKKDRFIFTVESVGSMPAATIVKKGISVLREKLESLEKLIDNA